MNKKLLLVSLLAVGMLVGCGNTGDGGSSSVAPSTDETPTTSEDVGGGENNWDGAFGQSGYYLVGEMNGWNHFWKYEGCHDFLFTQSATDSNVYTLTWSVTEEFLASDAVAGDAAGAVDYKVMYWDGNKAPSEWWPDGVANNGIIDAAGEYTLTFNKASKVTADKTDGSGTYTKYTDHVRNGDANPETAFTQGEARKFDPTFAKVTYRVSVEEGLEVPEGHSVYLHTWGLLDAENNDASGYFECTEGSNGVWSYTTTKEVVVDDGTGVGIDYGFCIIVDTAGQTTQNWDKKVSNSASADGNYGIHVTKTKHAGTASLKLADSPYWLKGTVHAPYSVAEAVAAMDAEGYVTDTEMAVKGTVTKTSYNSKYDSWNIWLEVPVAEGSEATYEFQVYSGKLGEGLLEPVEGDTIIAVGKSKIYTKEGSLPVYELAYSSNHGVSPQILDVIRLSDYYMRGSFDASWNALSTHQFRMTGEATQELTVKLAAGTEFKVAVADWSAEANGSHLVCDASVADGTFTGESNITCNTAGTYRFVLDLSGDAPVLTVYAA